MHDPKKAEVAVLKMVASRLKESREITGLNVKNAAELLGVQADYLQQVETGVDVDTVPLSLIKRAASLYDVSADWLLGIVEDWEQCEESRRERDFSAHLQNILIQEQAIVTAKLIDQDNQIAALSNAVTTLAPATKAVYDSILRFWELNQSFDDMPGGAPVINRLDAADKAGHEAVCQMVRHKFLPFEALQPYPVNPAKPKKSEYEHQTQG